MPDDSYAVVVTTVGRGEFLEHYYAAAVAEGVLDRVWFHVIPDRKTPPLLFGRVMEYQARGMKINCPTIPAQQAYLDRVSFGQLVPFDSDNRRNIGYLMAVGSGASTIISIDDDNFPRTGEQYFAEHAIVSRKSTTLNEIKTTDGWFNFCTMMDVEPAMVYPRGFPYARRHKAREVFATETTGRVTINAGLWLGEPDLDGMTWLVSPARSSGLAADSVLLGANTWSPVNTQNTALHRDVIASYYFARMNYPLAGMMSIDRYGDILSGYLAQACVKAMGHYIRVGAPAVDHVRNSHDYMKDATCEMGCVWLIEDLTSWLVEQRVPGATYAQKYDSLSHLLDEAAEKFTGFIWTDATRGYVHQLAYCMRCWTRACASAEEITDTVSAAA